MYRDTVDMTVIIAIIAKFIKNLDLTQTHNLTEIINTTIQVKTTVKPLIKIANVIMKNGRT